MAGEKTDYRSVSIMLNEDQSEDEWNIICQIILDELKSQGYSPLEVCIY